MQREETKVGLIHPEWVDGRRIWTEGNVSDVVRKLHYGDPTKGWEGDERLAVYFNPPRYELWRLEYDDVYRLVARSEENIPFDDRIIDALVQWDGRRRQKGLHDSIVDNNERAAQAEQDHIDAWVAEEIAPRLRYAMQKDGTA